ncbi:hypothetical protein [Microbacterium amylolyticum]|uniref:Protein ImuA n=1 Tax=Microbacterium amylolyticum TaxID=936337 RepID=A0ABS4ZEF7_9MICO|nr:hypothetical protein [Microbacterium amylolyticum]MBP2435665.1 hypothetical protein [Microbacterium amylolyticum]
MAVVQAAQRAEQISQVTQLRAQIGQMQRRTATVDALPVPSAISPLFPHGGLRPGAAYALPDSASLLLALLGAPSSEGAWCAAIGLPHLSAAAAEAHGADLSRLVFVPHPGERWMQAADHAAEVFPVVAVRPQGRVMPGEVARLDARLRDRGGTLLVCGPWPGADAFLTMRDPEWKGVDNGHGVIASRAVTIAAGGRGIPHERSVRVLLPGPSGQLESAAHAHMERPRLRAVGA